MTRLTVLGGGNTAFSMAAQLALDGYEVLIWEHPDFASSIAPLRNTLSITLNDQSGSRLAQISHVTTDPAEALAWSDTLLCSVPSYAHAPFAELIVPHLRPGHLLTLLPGNLGSLAFAQDIAAAGITGVIVCESDTAPYVCRKTAPSEATIWGSVSGLGIGVHPSSQTSEVVPYLESLFPGVRAHPNVLAAGLSAMNPVVHPPGVLLNAGRIERSRGDFYFYEEGVTPAVAQVIEALDAERLAIGRAYDLHLLPVADAFHAAGFGPAGDLWSVINGSRMLTALKAPGSLETRWLSEDVPYGLLPWSELAGLAGVPTPVIDALVTLTSALTGIDFRSRARSLADCGLGNADRSAVLRLLEQ
ncbi:MAG: NAD/NADP octopine/nopaline dehydrogenase family protein [Thermomicrobiales bacterium]